MTLKTGTIGLGLLALAGCSVNQADYASEPVLVKTDRGIVTCQLYRDDRVLWDEALSFPRSMSLQEADQICLEEGARVKKEGRRPTDTAS